MQSKSWQRQENWNNSCILSDHNRIKLEFNSKNYKKCVCSMEVEMKIGGSSVKGIWPHLLWDFAWCLKEFGKGSRVVKVFEVSYERKKIYRKKWWNLFRLIELPKKHDTDKREGWVEVPSR
jgi:hypothetical protein